MTKVEQTLFHLRTRLAAWAKFHPAVWQNVDALRAHRPKNPQDPIWPRWSFLPIQVYEKRDPLERMDLHMTRAYYPEIAMLSAWRQTQGFYVFDETLLDALWETPITGKLPAELLRRLPEWSTLFTVPERSFNTVSKRMLSVMCQVSMVGRYSALSMTLIDEEGVGTVTIPLMDTLEESIDFVRKGLVGRNQGNLKLAAFSYGSDSIENPTEGTNYALEIFDKHTRDLAGVISLALYLCSEEPEMEGRIPHPVTTKTKHGLRIFPPTKPTFIDVGVRLGAALRRGVEHRDYKGGTHPSPRAHILGQHWHMFWTGPKIATQVPKVKWLPPIPVNAHLGKLETTVRPVRLKVGVPT